jgi:hypothetical protein
MLNYKYTMQSSIWVKVLVVWNKLCEFRVESYDVNVYTKVVTIGEFIYKFKGTHSDSMKLSSTYFVYK